MKQNPHSRHPHHAAFRRPAAPGAPNPSHAAYWPCSRHPASSRESVRLPASLDSAVASRPCRVPALNYAVLGFHLGGRDDAFELAGRRDSSKSLIQPFFRSLGRRAMDDDLKSRPRCSTSFSRTESAASRVRKNTSSSAASL